MIESEARRHWARVYRGKAPTAVSWYQESPDPSLRALARFATAESSSLIDVGGGASNFADALLELGWQDITVLDIAAPALEAAKARLGAGAGKVRWEVADITDWHPRRRFDLWHDRAVFHFLTGRGQREAYRRAMLSGLADGGLAIIATFAPDGPEKCSGLPVRRYDPASLAAEMEAEFQLVDAWPEEHVTPSGASQPFNWCVFRRVA